MSFLCDCMLGRMFLFCDLKPIDSEIERTRHRRKKVALKDNTDQIKDDKLKIKWLKNYKKYVTPSANLTSATHGKDVGFIRGNPHLNWRDAFWVYGRPMNKTVQALLRIKTDNILSGLGWVMIDGIRVAPRVFLNDGRANLSENAESLKGVYITL